MTERPPPPVSLVNLPNALTVLRLILVPVFLLALFAEGGHDTTWRWIAWAIFAIAAITDRYDGHIARKRGQVTDFGKIADPIADKALTGSALIGLSMLGDLAWWVTAGHPGPGDRRHAAAVRGHQVRRHRRPAPAARPRRSCRSSRSACTSCRCRTALYWVQVGAMGLAVC